MKTLRFIPVTVALLIALTATASAQTPPAGPGKEGEKCRRGQIFGVLKKDPCGFLYCAALGGTATLKLDANFEKRALCTFKLVDNHCRCVPNPKK